MTRYKPVINYDGHEVVYSQTSDCSPDIIKKGTKFASVFEVKGDYYTAFDSLKEEQEKMAKSTLGHYHVYSSYILKIDYNKYEINIKTYFVPN